MIYNLGGINRYFNYTGEIRVNNKIELLLLKISGWIMVVISSLIIFAALGKNGSVTISHHGMSRMDMVFAAVKLTVTSPVFLIGLGTGLLVDYLDGSLVKKDRSTLARMIIFFVISIIIGFMMMAINT